MKTDGLVDTDVVIGSKVNPSEAISAQIRTEVLSSPP
jgi:hypothetical protein